MPELNPPPRQWPGNGRVIIAFSGGPDSLCLLHRLQAEECTRSITCLHIDHGLDDGSRERADEAIRLAQAAGSDCHVMRIEVAPGGSPEASARRARYDAIDAFMQVDDVVLTGHHADDQAETVLMRLLRGAGPSGLRGIPRQRRFGPGWIVRPMLDWTRADIERFLREHELSPVQDPANDSLEIDRNFVGQQLMPIIRRRWAGAGRAILRSGRLCHGAAETLAELAAEDLDRQTIQPTCVRLAGTRHWNPFRLGEMLRHWCHRQELPAPPGRRIEAFIEQLERASADRQPTLAWEDGVIRMWRERLWLQALPESPREWALEWHRGQTLDLPGDIGRLELSGIEHPPSPLQVRSAQPGEVFKPSGHLHHRPVTQLMAEHDIPPWQRECWPRLYLDGCLVGIGDIWHSAELERWLASANARLRWLTSLNKGC